MEPSNPVNDNHYPLDAKPNRKRKAESSVIVENLTPWQTITTVKDAMTMILGKLSIKDLLNFEQAAKNHSSLTDETWKRLRQKNFYCFDWKACAHKANPNKWNYILSTALMQFVEIHFSPSDLNIMEKHLKFLTQYRELRTQFACFRTLMDLNVAPCTTHLCINKPIAADIEQLRLNHQISIENNPWGGETLLQAIQEAEEIPDPNQGNKIVALAFERAIKKGATCASLLAIQLLPELVDTHFFLALQAAKAKDFRALTQLVENKDLEQLTTLKNAGHCFGPILNRLAKLTKDLKEQDDLYTQALADYGDQAPAHILGLAALTKRKLQQWKKADSLYTQALAKFGDQAPAELINLANQTKSHLKLEGIEKMDPKVSCKAE